MPKYDCFLKIVYNKGKRINLKKQKMENSNGILPPPQPGQLPSQPTQLTPAKKWHVDKAVMTILILVILAASSLAVYFILNQPQNLGPVVVSHHQETAAASPTNLTAPMSTATTIPVNPQTTTDASYCATSANQADCYAAYAQIQKNPEICKLASSQVAIDNCFFQAATVMKNLQLCSQIQTQSPKDHCYVFFGVANKDAKLCNMVVDQGLRQQCLSMPFQPTVATSTTVSITATKLNVNLDSSILNGKPGDSVKVTGQIQNSTTNILYLNGMTGSVVSVLNDPSNKGGDLTLDPTDFFSLVPPSFQPGQSYQGPIFSVQISSNAKAGTYIFSYTLEGGKTEKDLTGELWSEEVSIQVK